MTVTRLDRIFLVAILALLLISKGITLCVWWRRRRER